MSEQAQAEGETVRVWRVWKCALEMCNDRGYEILPEELEKTFDDFKEQYCDAHGIVDRRKLSFSARPSEFMLNKYTPLSTSRNPDPSAEIGTVWVEFNADQNVGIKQLRQFAHHLSQNNFYTGIFVSAVPVTPSATKIIPSVLPTIIELFNEQDLVVNITKHELVPRHVMLSAEEKRALLDRYRVKESQLPRIQHGDPVAKYFGLRKGQVVKIIRRSETAGRYASYRWCF